MSVTHCKPILPPAPANRGCVNTHTATRGCGIVTATRAAVSTLLTANREQPHVGPAPVGVDLSHSGHARGAVADDRALGGQHPAGSAGRAAPGGPPAAGDAGAGRAAGRLISRLTLRARANAGDSLAAAWLDLHPTAPWFAADGQTVVRAFGATCEAVAWAGDARRGAPWTAAYPPDADDALPDWQPERVGGPVAAAAKGDG